MADNNFVFKVLAELGYLVENSTIFFVLKPCLMDHTCDMWKKNKKQIAAANCYEYPKYGWSKIMKLYSPPYSHSSDLREGGINPKTKSVRKICN